MADAKISSLTELTSIATSDEFVVVDKSDTTMAVSGTTKKITQENLLKPLQDAFEAEHNQDGTHNLSAFTQADIVDLLRGDGWKTISDTATYVSSTTFYLEGDWTGRLQNGDKLKLTNSSLKYFYIVGVGSYDSGNDRTLITITGESDLVSGAISGVYFSKMENPHGFKRGEQWYFAQWRRDSDQNLNDAVETVITRQSTDSDPNSMISGNRIYFPITGKYRINANAVAYSASTKLAVAYLNLRKNENFLRGTINTESGYNGWYLPNNICITHTFNKGDFIDITANHDTIDNSQSSVRYVNIEAQFISV